MASTHPLLLDVVAAAPALLEALPVAAAVRLSLVCREARDLIAADAAFWASVRARLHAARRAGATDRESVLRAMRRGARCKECGSRVTRHNVASDGRGVVACCTRCGDDARGYRALCSRADVVASVRRAWGDATQESRLALPAVRLEAAKLALSARRCVVARRTMACRHLFWTHQVTSVLAAIHREEEACRARGSRLPKVRDVAGLFARRW